MNPLRLWRDISHYGVAAQSARERRRIVLTNQIILMGLAYSLVSIVMYLYFDFRALWPVLVTAAGAAMGMVLALHMNRASRHMLARTLLLICAWIAVAVHAWYLGIGTGVHQMSVLAWTGAFLLTPQRKLWLLVLTGTLFISLYFISVVYFQHPQPAAATIDPDFFTLTYVLSAAGTFGGISYVLGLYYLQNARAEALMLEAARAEASARRRSDKVLENVLPESIVERLKQEDGVIADRVDEATILFADIVGFTRLASGMPAAELVDTLNTLFSRFDQIVEDHDLEKIKTIGDAYMLAGGLPLRRVDHAEAVCHAALAMLRATRTFNLDFGTRLSIRIGIHSGSLVAGVIGRRKLAYDVWGDTVNVAARLESEGIKNQAVISDATHQLVKDSFVCRRVGKQRITGHQRIQTWLLQAPVENTG